MELEFLDSFLDDLYSVQLYQLQKDRMTWILSRLRDLNLILIILLCKHVGIHLGPAIWRAKSAPYIYIYMGDSELQAFNDREFKEAGHCYP